MTILERRTPDERRATNRGGRRDAQRDRRRSDQRDWAALIELRKTITGARTNVPGILREGAATFEARNNEYGDNYTRAGNIMKALFPDGITLNTPNEFLVWHIFELVVVKLSRLASTNISHVDSARDLMVYAAILEDLITPKEKDDGTEKA